MSGTGLIESLLDPGHPDGTMRVLDDEGPIELPWSEWTRRAERMAAGLRARGVQRGSRVACVLRNDRHSAIAPVAIWLAGATVVSLPVPARGMPLTEYARLLHRLVSLSEAQLLLTDPTFAPLLEAHPPDPATSVATYPEVAADGAFEPDPPAPDDLAFVQFSSGSTGNPKGCMLTADAIVHQVRDLIPGMSGDDPSEVFVSWLPLSHDMGFFGGLMYPWTLGSNLRLSAPERFAVAPRTWLDDCAEFQATASVVPPSALARATIAARRTPPSRPFPMRTLTVGAEPVDHKVLRDAAEALGPFGITYDRIKPAYGLAEATLAVTSTPAERGAVAITADPVALANGEVRLTEPGAGTSLVSAGHPLPGFEVQILGDGDIGEVTIRGRSVAQGYLNNPEQTRQRFVDGTLRTGDLGFFIDGELYLVGRTDDMIAVNGRNVYAVDVERRLNTVEGVRRGTCVLVDVPWETGRGMAVVAEPRTPEADHDRLAAHLMRECSAAVGTRPQDCLIVAHGTVPKTPTGKVARHRVRQFVLDPAESVLARASG
jgi:fatty-acyl-CoA synthase